MTSWVRDHYTTKKKVAIPKSSYSIVKCVFFLPREVSDFTVKTWKDQDAPNNSRMKNEPSEKHIVSLKIVLCVIFKRKIINSLLNQGIRNIGFMFL